MLRLFFLFVCLDHVKFLTCLVFGILLQEKAVEDNGADEGERADDRREKGGAPGPGGGLLERGT